jgi:hypothetical protein
MSINWMPILMFFGCLFLLIYAGILILRPMLGARMIFGGRPRDFEYFINPKTSGSALRWMRIVGVGVFVVTLYVMYSTVHGYLSS